MNTQINADSIANEIRLMKNKKFYVLVEGIFDAKFYYQFFDREKTVIKQCNGKETVIEVYEKLKKSLDKIDVLFILDRDYDFFLGLNIENDAVFYTDFHDLDIMLIQAGAFERFICYDCKSEDIETFKNMNNIANLKEYIFETAKNIGYLRFISCKDSYNFKFKSIEYKKFVNTENLSIDLAKLIKEVKNKSQMHNLNEEEILNKLSKPINIDLCLLNSGHDIINIVCEAMKKAIAKNSNRKYDHDLIQDKFLYGCDIEQFKNYGLYKQLKLYCNKNGHCMI